jgi:hypothetical protein
VQRRREERKRRGEERRGGIGRGREPRAKRVVCFVLSVDERADEGRLHSARGRKTAAEAGARV